MQVSYVKNLIILYLVAIIAVVGVFGKLFPRKKLKTEENKKASNFTKRLLFIIVLN